MKKQLTEQDKEELKKLYAEAKTQNLTTLQAFLERLVTEYRHDYGTICHALAMAAIAAATALNNSPAGGITGFQAGAVMWQFIKEWNHSSNEVGMKLLDYDNMLYPQYDYNFNTITHATFKKLQAEAARKLKEDGGHPAVEAHWQSIVDGVVPFGYTLKG